MLRSQPLRADFLLLTLFALSSLSGCGSDAQKTSQAGAPPPPAVQFAVVQQRDVALTSEWIATMDGFVNSQIQSHVTGYLIRQNYREGSVVRKGELLFEIDPRPFQAALDQSKAQLGQAQAQVTQAQAQLAKTVQDVTRDTPLAEAKAIAQSQMDDDLQAKNGAAASVASFQAEVVAAKAAVEQAELNLSYTKIVSLVDGVAGIALAQTCGDLVSPTHRHSTSCLASRSHQSLFSNGRAGLSEGAENSHRRKIRSSSPTSGCSPHTASRRWQYLPIIRKSFVDGSSG